MHIMNGIKNTEDSDDIFFEDFGNINPPRWSDETLEKIENEKKNSNLIKAYRSIVNEVYDEIYNYLES